MTPELLGADDRQAEPMRYHGLKLQHLRTLLAIAQSGTFSGAALDLDISQPTVSHAVAELESQLGVRLLERGRFGAEPTEVGRRVVEHVRRMEGILDAIVQEATLARGALSGRLRVNAFRSVATHVLPVAVARMRQAHPGVEVRIVESENVPTEMVSPLLDGRVDVAFTTATLAGEATFWELFRDPFVAVVPQHWQDPLGMRASLGSLLRHPMILGDSACWAPLRERIDRLAPGFRPAFVVSQDSTMLGMVGQGLGVAVMPSLAIDALPAGVRRVALTECVERRVGLSLAPGVLKVPAVRAFLVALRELYPGSEIPRLEVPSANGAAGAR